MDEVVAHLVHDTAEVVLDVGQPQRGVGVRRRGGQDIRESEELVVDVLRRQAGRIDGADRQTRANVVRRGGCEGPCLLCDREHAIVAVIRRVRPNAGLVDGVAAVAVGVVAVSDVRGTGNILIYRTIAILVQPSLLGLNASQGVVGEDDLLELGGACAVGGRLGVGDLVHDLRTAADRGVAGVDVQVVGRGQIGPGVVADVGRDCRGGRAEVHFAQVDGLEDVAGLVGDVVNGLTHLGAIGRRIGGRAGLIGDAGVLELGGLRDVGVAPAAAGDELRFFHLVRGDRVELAVAAVDLDAIRHALLGHGSGVLVLSAVGVVVAAALVEVGDGHCAGRVGHFDLAEPAELAGLSVEEASGVLVRGRAAVAQAVVDGQSGSSLDREAQPVDAIVIAVVVLRGGFVRDLDSAAEGSVDLAQQIRDGAFVQLDSEDIDDGGIAATGFGFLLHDSIDQTIAVDIAQGGDFDRRVGMIVIVVRYGETRARPERLVPKPLAGHAQPFDGAVVDLVGEARARVEFDSEHAERRRYFLHDAVREAIAVDVEHAHEGPGAGVIAVMHLAVTGLGTIPRRRGLPLTVERPPIRGW